MELPRAARAGAQLPVDVPDVGAADDRHLKTTCARRCNSGAHGRGISGAVWNRGSVPVKDQRLEAPIEA
jgi:hypothetical protein